MAMIAGYIDKEEQVYCPACWCERAQQGARPTEILVSDAEETFWILDACEHCGDNVKYQASTLLD
jgi:hypothetical protein